MNDPSRTEAESPQATFAKARPEDRSFVVQVAAESGALPGKFRGRVHHLPTADGGNFESLDGLLAIIRRILSRPESEESGA